MGRSKRRVLQTGPTLILVLQEAPRQSHQDNPGFQGSSPEDPGWPRGDLPFPHDISVEGVEDALVGQLQGVIEDLHVLAAFHFRGISHLHCCRQLLLPHLYAKGRVRTIPHITAGSTQLVSTQSQYSIAAL